MRDQPIMLSVEPITIRFAALTDAPLLAELNAQLIQDEGTSNPMSVPELQARMESWLGGDYRAVLFQENNALVAYALYRADGDSIYVRHFFVTRANRRRGLGSRALKILLQEVLRHGKRVRLEVLAQNHAAHAFYQALGFRDYAVSDRLVSMEWEVK